MSDIAALIEKAYGIRTKANVSAISERKHKCNGCLWGYFIQEGLYFCPLVGCARYGTPNLRKEDADEQGKS